jgi:hypothetical protein
MLFEVEREVVVMYVYFCPVGLKTRWGGWQILDRVMDTPVYQAYTDLGWIEKPGIYGIFFYPWPMQSKSSISYGVCDE